MLEQHPTPPWPTTQGEAARQHAVRSLGIIHRERPAELGSIARLAAHICGLPYGAVNLIGDDCEWQAATHGLEPQTQHRSRSMCARVICHQERIFYTTEAGRHPLFAAQNVTVAGASRPRTYVAARVESTDGHPYGTVCAFGDDEVALSDVQLDALSALADTARHLLDGKRTVQHFESLANIDALTGVSNRRALAEMATMVLHQARRGDARPAAVLFDLDNLKVVNDTYGHATGDQLIRRFAQRLAGTTRAGELVARIGGDEFVVFMPNVTSVNALVAARRIHQVVTAPLEGAELPVAIRASFGTGLWMHPHDTLEVMLHRADEAMYLDKRRRALTLL
ncbi:MAG: GGDEF domain-containing protein [Ilumatobacteraceae bacterium]